MSKHLKIVLTTVVASLLVMTGIALADNIFHGPTNVYLGGSGEDAQLGTVTAVGGICNGSEPATQLCNVNVYDLSSQTTLTSPDLAATDDLTVADDSTFTGDITVGGKFLQTPGNITGTTTLTTSSASVQFINTSASQITITLPAAANATGTRFMFRIVGALTGVTAQITSAEKDNIDGTLIVAGAVVDCRGEDYINIITDGETTADYVEVISRGYLGWVIGDSGVLTASKMTCTDPS